jgi:hypothetical protein
VFETLPTNATIPFWVDVGTRVKSSWLATTLEDSWGLVANEVKDLALPVLPHGESFRRDRRLESSASMVSK